MDKMEKPKLSKYTFMPFVIFYNISHKLTQ